MAGMHGEAGPPEPGPYRHYKGGLYTVVCVGRHSETEEWLVAYRAEADGSFWIRPLAMWVERVVHDGVEVPRFARLGPAWQHRP